MVQWLLGARRQDRRQEPGGAQFAGDHERAGIRKQLFRPSSPAASVVERVHQQQGVPRGRTQPDRERHLDLGRRQKFTPIQEGNRQGHRPRARGQSVPSATRPNSNVPVSDLATNYTKYPKAVKGSFASCWRRELRCLAVRLPRLPRPTAPGLQRPRSGPQIPRSALPPCQKRGLDGLRLAARRRKAASVIGGFIVVDMFASLRRRRTTPRGRAPTRRTAIKAIYR